MHKLCLLVAFALLSHEALGFRIRRQSEDKDKDLEDRYGWNRPGRFPNPGQLPWQGNYPPQGGWGYPQNQYPNMGQWLYPEVQYPGNFPWQFPGQNPRPGPGPQFPGQNPGQGQFPEVNPGQGQNPGPSPNPDQGTNPPSNSGPTTESATLQQCRSSCLVTPEYNPVCGSDNRTYDNPGRLLCEQACGVNVTQVRASRCPNAVIPPVA